MFYDLSNTRLISQVSIGVITFTELQNYLQLNQIEIDPWELDIIKFLDKSFIEAIIESKKDKQ